MTFEKRRREGFRNVFEEGRGNVNAGSGGGKDERSGGGVAIVGGNERSEVDEEERRHGTGGEGRGEKMLGGSWRESWEHGW